MQNQDIEITWAKPPGLFFEGIYESPPGGHLIFLQTRFTGDAACDWHGICNNAGCPTIVDWRAI